MATKTRIALCVALAALAAVASSADAALVLPAHLSSNMVLQHSRPTEIWGRARPTATITVKVKGGQTPIAPFVATTQEDGSWSVTFPAPAASLDAFVIVIAGDGGEVIMTNVLFGDVWFCSGQSNMQFTVDMALNNVTEIRAADQFPNIRLYAGAQNASSVPQFSLPTAYRAFWPGWTQASAETVGFAQWQSFSAVCWFHGRQAFERDPSTPIGLIASSFGGTFIEAWSSRDALHQCPQPPTPARPHPGRADLLHTSFALMPPGGTSPNDPSSLWNAMVVPFLKTQLKGFVWYQGENNVGRSTFYACQFEAMIRDWRLKFARPPSKPLPFLFVELAPCLWADVDDGVPELRFAQRQAARVLERVGFASAYDVGDDLGTWGSIHPRNKQEVGRRLGLVSAMFDGRLAPAQALGPTLRRTGVLPPSHDVGRALQQARGFERTIWVQFENDWKLHTKGTAECTKCCRESPFEVSMNGGAAWVRVWPSSPVIGGGQPLKFQLVLPVPVPTLLKLRYAWDDRVECALLNGNALPAVPFNTTIAVTA